VIFVIIDLDRPSRGLIRVGHDRLLELRDSMGMDKASMGKEPGNQPPGPPPVQ
jgi:hypothetical protein